MDWKRLFKIDAPPTEETLLGQPTGRWCYINKPGLSDEGKIRSYLGDGRFGGAMHRHPETELCEKSWGPCEWVPVKPLPKLEDGISIGAPGCPAFRVFGHPDGDIQHVCKCNWVSDKGTERNSTKQAAKHASDALLPSFAERHPEVEGQGRAAHDQVGKAFDDAWRE